MEGLWCRGEHSWTVTPAEETLPPEDRRTTAYVIDTWRQPEGENAEGERRTCLLTV